MAHILVIDDDESVCYLLQRLLTSAGHQVLTASDGKKALELCTNISFDSVITDIYMPEMEGLEFIKKVRKECPDIKIIAMSGGGSYTNIDFLKAARLMGADSSLQKPFKYEQLLSAVSNLVSDA